MDTEWIQKTSPEDAKEIIKKLSTSHIKKVSDIKKLISANKGMVEKFWDDKYPNGLGEEVIPKELRDMKVTAFMYLTKNKDKLMLELMNQTDFERTLFLLYDGTHQS